MYQKVELGIDFTVCEGVRLFCVSEFSRCGKEMGLLLPFKCRKENNAMKNCMASWLVAAVEETCQLIMLLKKILHSPVVRWRFVLTLLGASKQR